MPSNLTCTYWFQIISSQCRTHKLIASYHLWSMEFCWSNFYFIKDSSDRFSYFTLYHTPNLLIHPSLPSSLHTSSGIFKVHMPSVQLTWKYLSLAIFYFQVSESHFLYLIWNYYVILLCQVKITFLINITCFLPKPHTILFLFQIIYSN